MLEPKKKMQPSIWVRIKKDFRRNKWVYALGLAGILYYLIFHYGPMYGAVIAFKNYKPALGIHGSPWVGLSHFRDFFGSYYFGRLLWNTLAISLLDILWGFPAPILLALLLNEIKNAAFKRTVQTVTYIPHFISIIVICGMIVDFTSINGVVNDILVLFTGERNSLLLDPKLFRTIYISTNIWQQVGWGTIIYLAALSGIDPELYDAADMDGAGRFPKMRHITLPGIEPTIVILLILRIGKIMSVGFEKIILLYNPVVYETADVISTFVYRRGLLQADYSFSTAVGLFNAMINFALIIIANQISKRLTETSLW